MWKILASLFKALLSRRERALRAQLLRSTLQVLQGVRRIYMWTVMSIVSAFIAAFSFVKCVDYLALFWGSDLFESLNSSPFWIFAAMMVISILFAVWSMGERRWLKALHIDEQLQELASDSSMIPSRSPKASESISHEELYYMLDRVVAERVEKALSEERRVERESSKAASPASSPDRSHASAAKAHRTSPAY